MSADHHVVVAGDIIVDHHIYEGEREKPTILNHRGLREVRETGGAAVLYRLLNAISTLTGKANWEAKLGVEEPNINDNPTAHHAFAVWRPFPLHPVDKTGADIAGETREKVWRTHLKMGYGDEGNATAAMARYIPAKQKNFSKPDVLVLDDGGFLFRLAAQRPCWLLPEKKEELPRWILLKMSDPIARGDLWHDLAQDFHDRLVCLVSAADLRRECVTLSSGLSWERSVDDLRNALRHNHLLSSLSRCRHLVVTLSADGALWLDQSNGHQWRATLFFDANGAEGEWAHRLGGEVVGSMTAMAASLAHALIRQISEGAAEPDLSSAIETGLCSMRGLMREGHGRVVDGETPNGYPTRRIAKIIAEERKGFARARLDWPDPPGRHGQWTIVETSQRPLGFTEPSSVLGLARLVAIKGLPALKQLPHAKFGELITADRQEIETLRSIRRLMIDYLNDKAATKPLSIGVFGPPGAGKSFGVKQIAYELFGKEAWLEFNLSQFSGPDDLLGAFHKARDLVLAGKTPIVFWDEFDSGDYKWLRYLLAPMQDGRFQQGQLNHAVGRGVFVFAGGTTFTYGDFGDLTNPRNPKSEARILAKVPDFYTRLDAYYDVLGPNPRMRSTQSKLVDKRELNPEAEKTSAAQFSMEQFDEMEPDLKDIGYSLRRALFIRSKLRCSPEQRLDFDPDLLDALLLVPKYEHGARSLEKLVVPLRQDQGGPIRRSSLPAPAQLAMHVDFDAFILILNRNARFRMDGKIEHLAEEIHADWLDHEHAAGRVIPKDLDCGYKELAEIAKEDNRAAARRIPEVLAIADMGITQDDVEGEPSADQIKAQIEYCLERLAEAEHDGWVEQRVRNGWVFAKDRDDDLRHHPMIRKYDDLPRENKEKDRNSVRNYPKRVAEAGYRIVWLAQTTTTSTIVRRHLGI